MRGLRQLKAMWRDPNMKELIDSLWREYYGLYAEKYNRDPGKWLQNYLSADFDFGQAIGQDHSINSNKSIAVGIGGITTSFMETILGTYNLADLDADPQEWNLLDRLITIGNGIDPENRSNALEVFKSGLFKLFNALVIGKYDHENEIPEDGTLQFDQQKLQVFVAGLWKMLLTDAPKDDKPYGRKNEAWEEVAALDHDHEIGNVALLFENSLV